MATEPHLSQSTSSSTPETAVDSANGFPKALPKSRLYLEPLTPSKHLEAFHELWTYEETLVWFPFPVKKDVSESHEFLEKILPNEENPDIEKFALMLLPTEEGSDTPRREMVGFVGTNRYKEQGMEVGYVINRRHWGMGYATEGLRLFLDMYWDLPHRKYINRLVGKTSPGNVASQNILIKCGARKGETLKDATERWVDKGRKSDLICWFLDRPGFREENIRDEKMEREREARRVVLERMEAEGREGKQGMES